MPFQEMKKMNLRKKMIEAIENGQSVAEAAREAGVSRVTAYKWLRRAEQQGLDSLSEESRRPLESPRQAPQEAVEELLAAKARHPSFGAKKLCAWLQHQGRPLPFGVRTADRLLARHGLTTPQSPCPPPATTRFVAPQPNALWQCDFKGLGRPALGYLPLSVLDDNSRFALAFEPLPFQTAQAVFGVLWRLFGEVGLPQRLLSDNGPCFASTWAGGGPSQLEVKLWLLGIETTHGRPYHPQTQGKVERFHRTINFEAQSRGQSLRAPDVPSAAALYAPLVQLYNWERPHEELSMQTPGQVYSSSPRVRPATLPTHQVPEGALKRRVCAAGLVSWQGQRVRVGKALVGQWVEVEEHERQWLFRFANHVVTRLDKEEDKL